MFGAAMAYRDKHRLQPCEPKPRHAETRRHSPRRLRHENISNTALKTELGCGSRNFASYPVNNKFL